MPTRRRKLAPKRIGLTAKALEAWRAGDSGALRCALSISALADAAVAVAIDGAGLRPAAPADRDRPMERELATGGGAATGAISPCWSAAAETETCRRGVGRSRHGRRGSASVRSRRGASATGTA